jgi:hypothetical protein
VELSRLQSALESDEDRRVFSRLVFPRAQWAEPPEVLAVGQRDRQHVVVSSHIADSRNESYTVREPIEPAEIGRLYRLFLETGYPITVSGQHRHLVVIDSHDQIIGGLCYIVQEADVVHLDGIVVVSPLRHRGISRALIEDFCSRMASQGLRAVKMNFFSRQLFRAQGFVVDQRLGGLVRRLTD